MPSFPKDRADNKFPSVTQLSSIDHPIRKFNCFNNFTLFLW